LPGLSLAQTPEQPTFSKTPLATDQIAIYRVFLSSYRTGLDVPLNLSDSTEEFKADEMDLKGCLKQFAPANAAIQVHRFSNEFSDLHNVRLIDVTKHKTADPGDAIRNGSSVEAAVRAGFAAGILRVSEIVFDSTHQLAAISYSFYCGSLCGNGGTIIYELQDGKWSESKRTCARWVS
jgi:hypothetical protein